VLQDFWLKSDIFLSYFFSVVEQELHLFDGIADRALTRCGSGSSGSGYNRNSLFENFSNKALFLKKNERF
jgi:hypothetical protein